MQIDPTQNTQKRMRLIFSLGILLSAFIVASVSSYLLYRAQYQKLIDELIFATSLEKLVLSADVDRMRNIAKQVSSRTRIRSAAQTP